MIFTKEQYDTLEPLVLNDLCLDINGESAFNLFNALPQYLQGLYLQHGSDTLFNDDLFVYLIDKLFKCTPSEYYEMEIAKMYFKNSEWKGISPEHITLNGYNIADFTKTNKPDGIV